MPTTLYMFRKNPNRWRQMNGGPDILWAPPVDPPPDPPPTDTFVLGVTMPIASNTGFRIPESSLTNYAGSLTNVKQGETVSGLAITGNIQLFTNDNTYRDCLILMGSSPYSAGTTYAAISGLRTGVTGALFEFCTVRPTVPTVDVYGPWGGGFTVRRCDISGVSDGFSINGVLPTPSTPGQFKFVRIEGSFIHDLGSYAVDPRQGGGHSHNDGIQAAGWLDLEVVGTRVDGGYTSAMLIQQNGGTYIKALIDRNWINGSINGGSAFNSTENNRGPITNFSLTGNRFGSAKPYILVPNATINAATTTISGNVLGDGPSAGQPVKITNAG